MRTPRGMDGPFAWGDSTDRATGLGGLARVERRRVIQCALSRICGVCADSLGRPIAFVGDSDEIARNAFHAPPLHHGCARDLLDFPGADPRWQVVTTAAYELVRPSRDDADRHPRFVPVTLVGGPDRTQSTSTTA